jgi:hypothetical protein
LTEAVEIQRHSKLLSLTVHCIEEAYKKGQWTTCGLHLHWHFVSALSLLPERQQLSHYQNEFTQVGKMNIESQFNHGGQGKKGLKVTVKWIRVGMNGSQPQKKLNILTPFMPFLPKKKHKKITINNIQKWRIYINKMLYIIARISWKNSKVQKMTGFLRHSACFLNSLRTDPCIATFATPLVAFFYRRYKYQYENFCSTSILLTVIEALIRNPYLNLICSTIDRIFSMLLTICLNKNFDALIADKENNSNINPQAVVIIDKAVAVIGIAGHIMRYQTIGLTSRCVKALFGNIEDLSVVSLYGFIGAIESISALKQIIFTNWTLKKLTHTIKFYTFRTNKVSKLISFYCIKKLSRSLSNIPEFSFSLLHKPERLKYWDLSNVVL